MKPSSLRKILTSLVALALPALAEEQAMPDSKETFGAVATPATLPPGAVSAYGFLGVPEVGAGYRQGLARLELEARIRFNYLLLSATAEALARYPMSVQAPVELAPYLGLGVTGNTGSQYLDSTNFPFVGLRALGGMALTYSVAETVRLLGQLDVPFDLALGRAGGSRLTPVLGGGAEIYLGEDITALALGQLGVDVIKSPSGLSTTRLGYTVRLGLGFRLF